MSFGPVRDLPLMRPEGSFAPIVQDGDEEKALVEAFLDSLDQSELACITKVRPPPAIPSLHLTASGPTNDPPWTPTIDSLSLNTTSS